MLAVEKIITSKLLKPGANKRIATVDRHVGIVRHPDFSFNRLLITFIFRFPPDSSLMAATSFLELEMKLLRGGVHTRDLFQPTRLPIVWVVTCRRTHSTPAYGRSV